ncbi:hypothetical protein [Gemmatirosa kalamazoonensis]|uniref:hypothetical protein n=1 Tax=Gemmatirosa kalamazoonensis TaxID=861299 RepID=UPI0011DE0C61|nr:hypothetical protein [Gemmatirosa kalamazoonensis]
MQLELQLQRREQYERPLPRLGLDARALRDLGIACRQEAAVAPCPVGGAHRRAHRVVRGEGVEVAEAHRIVEGQVAGADRDAAVKDGHPHRVRTVLVRPAAASQKSAPTPKMRRRGRNGLGTSDAAASAGQSPCPFAAPKRAVKNG